MPDWITYKSNASQRSILERVIIYTVGSLVALFFGFIINILVANSFRHIPTPTIQSFYRNTGSDRVTTDNIKWWRQYAPPSFPDKPEDVYYSSRIGVVITDMEAPPPDPEHNRIYNSELKLLWDPMFIVSRLEYGWPLLSVEKSMWFDSDRFGNMTDIGDIKLPVIGKFVIQPVYPGIVINTIIYALVLAAAWITMKKIMVTHYLNKRSRARLKKGTCPNCQYPIGQSKVCTECKVPLDFSLLPHQRPFPESPTKDQ